MKRRTDRHIEESSPTQLSRLAKNRYLYDDINNVIGYEEITDFNPENGIDLSNIKNSSSREEYKKYKDYQDIFGMADAKKEEAIEEEEKKVYDINSVLEDAKRNRTKYDELEKKRKLKENKYVTLADTDTDADTDANRLNVIKEEKNLSNDIDEKELTDLINTITSHNLLKDIKEAEETSVSNDDDNQNELLSDLLATSIDLNLEDGIASEYLAKKAQEAEEEKMDSSFYTKSMDLSEQDFEFSDEIEAERKVRVKVIIILVVILLIVVIGVISYLFLKQKGIIK